MIKNIKQSISIQIYRFNQTRYKFIFLFLFKFTLDLLYYRFIIPYYYYTGMDLSFNLIKYIVGIIVFFINALIIINIKEIKPSYYFLLLVNVIYFIPGGTYFSFSDVSIGYIIYFSLYWLFFNFIFFINSKTKDISIKYIFQSKKIFILIVIITVIISLYMTGYYNGFLIYITISEVYELRETAYEIDLPIFFSYFRSFASVFIPLVLGYHLSQKKYLISILLILVQLFLFSFGGHKTSLFLLIAAIFIAIIWKKEFNGLILPFFILINFIGMIESILTSSLSTLIGLLQRRIMFTPNFLSEQYFNFFINNPDYFRQSIFRHLGFVSDYNLPFSSLIAIYLGVGDKGANNGLVGDAVGNLGILGILFMPIFIMLVLKIFDIVAKDIDRRFILIISLIYVINFTNSSIFTILFTHGFILLLVALYFFPKNNKHYFN